MAISVVMPALEMAQETGKLISWLKNEGETVAKGDPLLEIETDKAVMEIESPGDGVLAGIKVQSGAEVQVGRTIAWILRPGEVVPADETPLETGRKSTAGVASSQAAPAPATSGNAAWSFSSASNREVKISPKARRLAAERGLDLSQLQGSGPAGEILTADIVTAAEKQRPGTEPGNSIARLMAERTTQSWTTVPHFFLTREVNAAALIEVRERLSAESATSGAVKITVTDLLVAVVAQTLLRHQQMNASWSGAGSRSYADVNIGVAVAVEGGVVAPVIAHADKATVRQIATRRLELVERARSGKLRPQDIAGGTFTISNLGMYGVDAFSAIITPPQAAILAVGRITDRVVAVQGQAVVRAMMTLNLSSDHRVVDGARAAEFLRDLAESIELPHIA